jgi:hypothetical protein
LKNYIALDQIGQPLAKIKAPNRGEAEALGMRRIVGCVGCTEVKSMAPDDIEREVKERIGLSAHRINIGGLPEYEREEVDNADLTSDEQHMREMFRSLGMGVKEARVAARGRRL